MDDQGNEHGLLTSVFMLLTVPTLRWLYVGLGVSSFMHYPLMSWLAAYFMRSQDVAGPAIKTMSFGLLAVFFSYLPGGAWGPAVVGAISDGLGGGAEGLESALIIVWFAGFFAAVVEWPGSRTYPADMTKVRSAALQAERWAGIEQRHAADAEAVP